MKTTLRHLLSIAALVTATQAVPAAGVVTHYEAKELRCMMSNIYFEARGEPFQGMVAVAKVTLNRATTTASVCKEVYRPYQFSWTITKPKLPQSFSNDIFHAAHLALQSPITATHYHAVYVKPYWAKKLTRTKQIGQHIFYK